MMLLFRFMYSSVLVCLVVYLHMGGQLQKKDGM